MFVEEVCASPPAASSAACGVKARSGSKACSHKKKLTSYCINRSRSQRVWCWWYRDRRGGALVGQLAGQRHSPPTHLHAPRTSHRLRPQQWRQAMSRCGSPEAARDSRGHPKFGELTSERKPEVSVSSPPSLRDSTPQAVAVRAEELEAAATLAHHSSR